ncbi:GDSL/SGNH-like acyl-esterase family found in Pmr5 and Cas1p-domain-containing protein [Thamnidium elegans]|uniref:Trichome birefringence-like C-terminal domain-containing protein n=1 Tax=Thamnidium elegans TaxID=101142 RepID=A0A8H7VU35_9FUNG|nr:hypothetical protein INT48_007530 [Thamnidium elegans]KAI8080315.1 GDSL/SGNH-like acyl-esterase family found in Pmr5 and Cas1p-domain-containing protein [Thamnidium elegans]
MPELKKFIVVGLSATCLFSLWLLSNTNSIVTEQTSNTDNQDILYQEYPSSKNICTVDSFNTGQWVHQDIGLESHSIDGLSSYAGYHCNWDFPHRCYMRSDQPEEFNRSKAILDYTWQPDHCTLLPFEPRKFSKHLSQNPLLLVGDSITQLMYESMWCLTGQDLTAQSKDTGLNGGDTEMWASQLVHRDLADQPDQVTVGFIRSDYLVKLDDFSPVKPNGGQGYLIGVGNNFPWVHAISRFKYIMINTGPHWHPDLKWGPNKDRKELLKAFEKGMTQLLKYLKKNLSTDQRLWIRSSPYGHAQCSQYTAPDVVPVKPTGKEGEYEWDMLEKFDHIWKNLIEKENDERFRFFNVSMANLRGDAHSRPDSDCLHTCLPGPVDDWNKYLFHEITKLVIEQ